MAQNKDMKNNKSFYIDCRYYESVSDIYESLREFDSILNNAFSYSGMRKMENFKRLVSINIRFKKLFQDISGSQEVKEIFGFEIRWEEN